MFNDPFSEEIPLYVQSEFPVTQPKTKLEASQCISILEVWSVPHPLLIDSEETSRHRLCKRAGGDIFRKGQG